MQAQSLDVHDPLLTALDLMSPRSQLRAGAQGQSASVPRRLCYQQEQPGSRTPPPAAGTPPAAGRAWRARASPGWERRERSPLPAPGVFFPRGPGRQRPLCRDRPRGRRHGEEQRPAGCGLSGDPGPPPRSAATSAGSGPAARRPSPTRVEQDSCRLNRPPRPPRPRYPPAARPRPAPLGSAPRGGGGTPARRAGYGAPQRPLPLRRCHGCAEAPPGTRVAGRPREGGGVGGPAGLPAPPTAGTGQCRLRSGTYRVREGQPPGRGAVGSRPSTRRGF